MTILLPLFGILLLIVIIAMTAPEHDKDSTYYKDSTFYVDSTLSYEEDDNDV